MKVKDLKIGELYFSKSNQVVMKYCGVEHFRGHKYHNFYDPEWKLFYWLTPRDLKALPSKSDTVSKLGEKQLDYMPKL
jgi:hypothetical protein